MIINEESVAAAINEFVRLAQIPRPDHWTPEKDRDFLINRLVPAYLASLEKIEDVNKCHGFDSSRIFTQNEIQQEGAKHQ